MPSETSRVVLIHCNAGLHYGMGHLMRALTIGAEAIEHGWSVVFAGDFDAQARHLIGSHVGGVQIHSIESADQRLSLPRLAEALAPDVIHVDSYLPESDALVGSASILSNMQDGPFGVRRAELSIDQTLRAEFAPLASRVQSHLAGISYALIRPQVRAQRGRWSPSPDHSRVLAVLGGTDPLELTPRLVESISKSRRRLAITVVAPASTRDEVERIARRSPSRVVVTGFLPDLPAAAVHHDLVISAAGTSVWDFACMGVPTALVCVTENQERGYDTAVAQGLAVDLQRFPGSSWAHVADRVVDVLDDGSRLRGLSAAGMDTVDGLGAWRVIGSWESLLRTPPRPASRAGFDARPVTIDDARMLLDWRNDDDTRRMSRCTGVVAWEDHLAWLANVMADSTRKLLVVESDGVPVGTVRWDHRGGIDWEVSIAVAPWCRGKGLASSVLAAGERALRTGTARRLIAGISDANLASRRLFAGAGYLPYTPPDPLGFAEYAKLQWPSGE